MNDKIAKAHRVLLRYPRLDALVCRYLQQGESQPCNKDEKGSDNRLFASDLDEPQED